MPRLTLPLLTLLLLTALPATAQRAVHYEIAFPNAVHHEAEVTATFTGLAPGQPLRVRMSRTSPGRYALHEFAKNVYHVRVTDGAGQTLPTTRPDPHQWEVTGHDGTVTVVYTLFADRADGTYSGIDATHAHLNMPATFMWAPSMADAPIRATFHSPEPAWRIATQLFPTDDAHVFTAPDLAYFMDSPTELSAFTLRSWTIEGNGETYEIRLALHHAGTEAEADDYAAMTRKVVDAQVDIFDAVPDFDGGTYTFIACYLPHVIGDGMEHRNSTILTSTWPLAIGALRNLGTVAHEFFHAWNVERIRPQTLEPFDYAAANLTDALWIAEGFTSYYTGLTLRRAGLTDDDAYARTLGGTIGTVTNAPGRRFASPMGMSEMATLVDRAPANDPRNLENTFISYYTWGSAVGLALDLTLRARYGSSLDAFMQALWQTYGVTEVPYTTDDLEATLARLTDDPTFAGDFFARYIEGREVPDYAALLTEAGLVLRKANAGRSWLGSWLRTDDGHAVIGGRTLVGSPLYEAGLDAGDVLLEIDGLAIRSADHVEGLLAAHAPGDVLQVTYRQRGLERTADLILAEDPALEVVTMESLGDPPTAAQLSFREAWLARSRE